MNKINVILVALVMSVALVGCQKKAPAETETEVAPTVESFETTKALAEKGDATAQKNLGKMYFKGEAVAQNDIEAVKWFRLAADQGNATAQFYLGMMYDFGKGVAENDVEAVKWFRLAADQGDATGQQILGYKYDYGEGVAQNDVQAYKWFNLAAAQGDFNAKTLKEKIEKRMTREQIAEAQKLSAEWKPKQ